MTLEKYKNMVYELYKKESRTLPNYSIIKNSFEFLDLRKDGVLDINEWSKSFTLAQVNTLLLISYLFFSHH